MPSSADQLLQSSLYGVDPLIWPAVLTYAAGLVVGWADTAPPVISGKTRIYWLCGGYLTYTLVLAMYVPIFGFPTTETSIWAFVLVRHAPPAIVAFAMGWCRIRQEDRLIRTEDDVARLARALFIGLFVYAALSQCTIRRTDFSEASLAQPLPKHFTIGDPFAVDPRWTLVEIRSSYLGVELDFAAEVPVTDLPEPFHAKLIAHFCNSDAIGQQIKDGLSLKLNFHEVSPERYRPYTFVEERKERLSRRSCPTV